MSYQLRFLIVCVLFIIIYYILFKTFYIGKRIKKYIEDGYNDDEIENNKRRLNKKLYFNLLAFILSAISLNIISHFKGGDLIKVIAIVIVIVLTSFLDNKFTK